MRWVPPAIKDREIRVEDLQPMPTRGAFSVSVRPPKRLAGTITEAGFIDEFGDEIVVDTDVRYAGVEDDLGNRNPPLKLRQAGRLWDITGNTTGWPLHLYLRLRSCEPKLPARGEHFEVVAVDGQTPPTPYLLDQSNAHWRDYRDPEHWGQALHVEPNALPWNDEPPGQIIRVDPNGNGTSTVTTNRRLDDDSNHYLGGELEMDIEVRNEAGELETHNATWPVIGHTTGDSFQLTVLNNRRDRVTGKVEQIAPLTGEFIYWPDIVIPIDELVIPDGQAAAYAAVAVNTEDQTGNPGHTSPPQIIVRLDRTTPLAATPNRDVLMATPADFYGHSFFTVRWTKQSNVRYQVYRVLAEHTDDGQYVEPPEDTWPARYRLLTPEPLDPADPTYADKAEPGHVANADLMAYRDTLDGKSSSHYFYRVRAVNAAGTRGPWAERDADGHYLPAIGPVACPDVVPPRAPAITKVLGGDRQITLRWGQNREPDLAGYRVYRADSKDKAEDLRLMERVPTEDVPPAACAEYPGEVCWTDMERPGLVTFYYRVVAVDDSDNVSKPSPVVAGRAYDNSRPEPPAWNPARPGELPDSVVLSWTSPDPNLRCLVQRHIADAYTWENASGWLDRGVYIYIDENREPGVQYVYRLRVLDTAGKTNVMYNELTT